MKSKEFLELFIPPIIIKIWHRIKNGKVKLPENPSTVKNIRKLCGSLVVIGNGPSLNETLKNQLDKVTAKDCIVVNSFCKTEYYEKIKPRLYLLADSAFFYEVSAMSERLKEVVYETLKYLISKTTWDLNLVVPHMANGSYFINEVTKNPYIHVFYYNSIDLSGSTEKAKYELWDENLVPPPAQTCLNTCVWLGIFLRYKKLYIIGADTSWIEDLHVDQENNMIYSIDKHFYGEKKIYLYSDVEGKIPQKLHEEINCISRALSSYWELKEYADYAGVEVYNASAYSLIDAYERSKV